MAGFVWHVVLCVVGLLEAVTGVSVTGDGVQGAVKVRGNGGRRDLEDLAHSL